MLKGRTRSKGKPRSALGQLLGTDSQKEQVSRVRSLLMPVWAMTIYVDPRTGMIDVKAIGPDVPIEVAYKMLDDARRVLIERERSAKVPNNGQTQETIPATDLPHGQPQLNEQSQGDQHGNTTETAGHDN